MQQSNARAGILLMLATVFVFAVQDGISKHLAENYNTWMVVMLRYWFFAAFVLALAARRPGGLRAAASSKRPVLQIFRGLLLVAEVCVMVIAFTRLGLSETHAVFIAYPLIITALSGPVLGEVVGPRRWAAIGIGFIGVLIVLRPGLKVFSPDALIPLLAAFMFALYGLLTRMVARDDDATTSFFWTGVAGAAGITLVGVFHLEPMTLTDSLWMLTLGISGAFGHYLLIKAYEMAEASVVQPFAYFHLVFVTAIGVSVFSEELDPVTFVGAGVIILAGVYTAWRERQVR
ncbi:MAG: DMT family transporter [Pseudomonadota bacterium]